MAPRVLRSDLQRPERGRRPIAGPHRRFGRRDCRDAPGTARPLGLQLCGCSAEWRPGHGTVQRGHRRPRRHLRPTRSSAQLEPHRLGARDPNHHQIGRLLILCLREWADPPSSTDLLDQQPRTIGPFGDALGSNGVVGQVVEEGVQCGARDGAGERTISVRWGRAATAVVSPWRRVRDECRDRAGSNPRIRRDHRRRARRVPGRHGGSHGVALLVGDELALGDDHEIRRLELPQQKRTGALIGKSLPEVRGVDQNNHTIETEPILSAHGMTCVGQRRR